MNFLPPPQQMITASPGPSVTFIQQFNLCDEAPKARRSDPETSHKAAERSKTFASSHVGRIIEALRNHGPMSPKRLFDFTGLSVVQCDRRRKEMIDGGLIRIVRDGIGKAQKEDGCEVWEALDVGCYFTEQAEVSRKAMGAKA